VSVEDRCVVFLGNRVSLEAAELKDRAYPEQKALARQLGWRKPTAVVGKKGTIASVEEGAAAYERANGRAGLLALLERELGGLETPSPAHLAVVRRFPLVFTSNYDDLLERAGREAGVTVDVLGRQSPIPDPEPGRCVLFHLRGEFSRPETMTVTAEDHAARPLGADLKRQLRLLLRKKVVLFVGYRPDEEEFERLFAELSDAYGGELPRCHLSVAQGPIDDFLWQKWVWRGLLMFTADPIECFEQLEAHLR
jgi:hypothetical protein